MKKVLALFLALVMTAALFAACGEKKEDSKTEDGGSAAASDIFAGTWKQTDEVNGDWTWTFDGAGKCTLHGDTTGFDGEGTYSIDESAKTATVKIDAWDNEKVYDYTLEGDHLDLVSDYSTYHLDKQ